LGAGERACTRSEVGPEEYQPVVVGIARFPARSLSLAVESWTRYGKASTVFTRILVTAVDGGRARRLPDVPNLLERENNLLPRTRIPPDRAGIAAAFAGSSARGRHGTIAVDPKPLFEISPVVYMQFMERSARDSLGGGVCWDRTRTIARKDFVRYRPRSGDRRDRFGGLFSAAHHLGEKAGGPAAKRPGCRTTSGGLVRRRIAWARI